MGEAELTKEERVLRMMKNVLTGIARDTATEPGLKHPLSKQTIHNVRECLMAISAREQELAKAHGRDISARPRYVDEPASAVVVSLDTSKSTRRQNSSDD